MSKEDLKKQVDTLNRIIQQDSNLNGYYVDLVTPEQDAANEEELEKMEMLYKSNLHLREMNKLLMDENNHQTKELLYKFNKDLFEFYDNYVSSRFNKIKLSLFEEWQIDVWFDRNVK